MKKTGIVFPGQGSQYIGMGKDLYERFDYVRDLFATADRVLGAPMTDLCFNGPDDELRQTYNTQPSLLLVSYAVWQAMKRQTGIEPYLVAGHSLGEYTALLATENVTIEFSDSAIDALGRLCQKVNDETENIGARRLHTLMECLLEDILFEASERSGTSIRIDETEVERRLAGLIEERDLSRFIL